MSDKAEPPKELGLTESSRVAGFAPPAKPVKPAKPQKSNMLFGIPVNRLTGMFTRAGRAAVRAIKSTGKKFRDEET
jgi:hypothetical protein